MIVERNPDHPGEIREDGSGDDRLPREERWYEDQKRSEVDSDQADAVGPVGTRVRMHGSGDLSKTGKVGEP